MIITAANTVSRATNRRLRAASKHERNDQRDLDHRDGEREHERAERLADPMRDHLGVMHGGEHAATRPAAMQPGGQGGRDVWRRRAGSSRPGALARKIHGGLVGAAQAADPA